jgi:hypothetical protein
MRRAHREKSVSDYPSLTVTELTALWRRDIVRARIKLVSDGVTPRQEAELWQIVDSREWFLRLHATDYAGELEKIDREIEDVFRRK